MNKTNVFKSSEFYMATGDILTIIIKDESGVTPQIILVGEEAEEAPGAPTIDVETNVASTSFSANWFSVENADGYYLDVSTDADFVYFVAGFEDKDVSGVNTYSVTGLAEGTNYYYRVRAYNDYGTSGNSGTQEVTTTATADLVDLDGNVYTTVKIGNQEWIVENFRCTKYADGSAIPNITSSGTTYSDYFLPSKDELNEMYLELAVYGVGGLGVDAYWSSSESTNPLLAWAQDMSTGLAGVSSKTVGSQGMRACRTFTTTDIYSLRDIGEAGGYIFHIIDNGGGSFTYYEAAQADSALGTWSNVASLIGTGTAIGTGAANTLAIIAQVGHTTSAAQRADSLSQLYGGWVSDTSGAYCWYNNDIANKDDYGALYNWYAVNVDPSDLKDIAYLERDGVQESGWRTPTEADFNELSTYLGGDTVSGGKLKETGFVYWDSPNIGATNESGFTALGGGYRDTDGGFYGSIKTIALFVGDGGTLTLIPGNAASQISSYLVPNAIGASVRLVKDYPTSPVTVDSTLITCDSLVVTSDME